jgi:hypothetical protein
MFILAPEYDEKSRASILYEIITNVYCWQGTGERKSTGVALHLRLQSGTVRRAQSDWSNSSLMILQ